jgi:hypothetical protein
VGLLSCGSAVLALNFRQPSHEFTFGISVNLISVCTFLGPLPRWVPGPTTRWAPGLHDLCRTVPDGVRRKDYGGEVLAYDTIHTMYCVEDS